MRCPRPCSAAPSPQSGYAIPGRSHGVPGHRLVRQLPHGARRLPGPFRIRAARCGTARARTDAAGLVAHPGASGPVAAPHMESLRRPGRACHRRSCVRRHRESLADAADLVRVHLDLVAAARRSPRRHGPAPRSGDLAARWHAQHCARSPTFRRHFSAPCHGRTFMITGGRPVSPRPRSSSPAHR